MKRSSILATAAVSASAVAIAPEATNAARTTPNTVSNPITGRNAPELAAFDRFMLGFLKE